MNINKNKFDAVVCGAGIVGIAAARALCEAGLGRVALVDPEPPLSVTSDKSTECYRNWWPGPGDAMVALMNRSIDLMEAQARRTHNRFLMTRRGYVFATADENRVADFETQALEAQALGAGPLRHIGSRSDYRSVEDRDFCNPIDGADLLVDRQLIGELYPYLSSDTVGILHTRRCGSLSAQQLGMLLLEEARIGGTHLIAAELTGVELAGGRVCAVTLGNGELQQRLETDCVVIASGPYLNTTLAIVDIELPVVVEKHVKISLPDPAGILPRSAPLLIWADPIALAWTNEERAAFTEEPALQYLLQTFPAGVHGRPVGGGNQVLMYWTYNCHVDTAPVFPLSWDEFLPEITLRGMGVMVPGLGRYFDPMPRPYVDGGYYTKTPDNRPLIGPLSVPGSFVCSAFSGYGIMAAQAAAELLALWVTGDALPQYAFAFKPDRFGDPAYLKQVESSDMSGQL
ncbi:MAG: NAD(P)/FAD-dependent oxidoreductase [Hyphomicrobiaceae bacterium]